MHRISRSLAWLVFLSLALPPLQALAQPPVEPVAPAAADPRVPASDQPSLVYGDDASRRDAPLVVFLPGTHGASDHAPDVLLNTVAALGYRVVFLTYEDDLAGSKLCPRTPEGCYARFRGERLFGGDEPPAPTPAPQAIVPRLTALLRYMERQHPGAGWGGYLAPTGEPDWSRIVVSGLSQGAGEAAFLAKRYPVRRVVLFSSPWDFTQPGRRPASWLADASATPPDRWWAERHVRENTTQEIANAYRALRIPSDHILLFDGPALENATGQNPYHGSTIRQPAYAAQWRTLFGPAG